MPNTFLEGLQRPAILQNNGSGLPDYSEANDGDALIIDNGEPVWGAVDALPEIEETDEGKVLSVDQGEAVWADAPSGLPDIGENDSGKVLTVVSEGEVTAYAVPEQTLTNVEANTDVLLTGASFVGLSNGTPVHVVIDASVGHDDIDTNTYYSDANGIQVLGKTDAYEIFKDAESDDIYFISNYAVDSITISVTYTTESSDLVARWEEQSAIGNQCTVGSILSTAFTVMVGSLVQQSIQASATKRQHVGLTAPLNDYIDDATSIKEAVLKSVNDGMPANLSVLGLAITLQTCSTGQDGSSSYYTVCGTIPSYLVNVPQVGDYLFRIIVTLSFSLDTLDNVTAGYYEVTVEPVVTPSQS